MRKDNKKRKNPVVLALYTISILLGIYTIFTIYCSYTYISSLGSQGLVIKDELQSVINYFGTASVPFLFYSIATFAIGYIIDKLNYITNDFKKFNREDIKEETIITDNNEDISEDIKEEAIIIDNNEDISEDIKEEI
ncbi:hypothetical protein [Metaclostridioides mangenotii]|uniref:Uncharacterized protein n=1 Tax=Metaclostridioides mangenotii TaxID=1540 RepID=A0ABS4E7Z7_9FIRM|nr:hypothetical protein [Clostridioides mangenotii]MBP1854073.1 hypothetical protein [Clostridioides mangenotii]